MAINKPVTRVKFGTDSKNMLAFSSVDKLLCVVKLGENAGVVPTPIELKGKKKKKNFLQILLTPRIPSIFCPLYVKPLPPSLIFSQDTDEESQI